MVADYNGHDKQLIAYQLYNWDLSYLTHIEWNYMFLLSDERGHNDDWELIETCRFNKNLLKIHEVRICVEGPNFSIFVYKETWYLAQNLNLLSLRVTVCCDIMFKTVGQSVTKIYAVYKNVLCNMCRL